jgi:hypothetical protein
MRTYDISSRVDVRHCAAASAASGASVINPATSMTVSDGILVPWPVDRTGFQSWMLHVCMQVALVDAGAHVATVTAVKMQSYSEASGDENLAANVGSWVDMTSVTTTDVNYKPLYMAKTGVLGTPWFNLNQQAAETPAFVGAPYVPAGGNFVDQPFTYDSTALVGGNDIHDGEVAAYPVILDMRIFGSFRDYNTQTASPYEHGTVGKYIAPYISVTSTAAYTMYADLLLGGGDEMPVIQGNTMGGTRDYYSRGT